MTASMVETTDFNAIKTRQRAAWSAGDYAVIGTTLQIVGEQLCESLDLHAGEKVLDVAAGNGNASLAAARRWAVVTASDYVPELLQRADARAVAEGLVLATREADAEALPFDTASFDVVTSTFGVMFTPDQARAAAELLRVTRPGGRIGLANWTPTGFIGQLFKVIGTYLPPAAGVRSPALWGTVAHLEELFPRPQATIDAAERTFVFRYRSPEHWLEVFRTWYGPVNKAFDSLDLAGRGALETDLLALTARFNRAEDGSMIVPSDYLEVVIGRN